jgi:hypothetical protein
MSRDGWLIVIVSCLVVLFVAVTLAEAVLDRVWKRLWLPRGGKKRRFPWTGRLGS